MSGGDCDPEQLLALARAGDRRGGERRHDRFRLSCFNNETIRLTSGALTIANNLDIQGPGAGKLSISGNDGDRVFDIHGGAIVTLAGLTLRDGISDHGGAILNEAGATLTLSQVRLTNNQAVRGNGGQPVSRWTFANAR